MSEIVKVESIIISIVFKCPVCGYMNIINRSHMPLASTVVNDEVELFYAHSCKECNADVKVGIVASSV